MPNQSKKSNINKKSKLIYVLIGVIAVIIVAIGIIFACATTTKTKEKTWTTEDSMRQSKIDQQESVAKQFDLKAKLEYSYMEALDIRLPQQNQLNPQLHPHQVRVIVHFF